METGRWHVKSIGERLCNSGQIKVNNMKKHAIANYYDNIDSYLMESKAILEILKDTFHTKSTTDIPPIKYTNNKGTDSFAFSDIDKIELLNNYFTSISSLDDNDKELPIMQPRCTVNFPNLVFQEQEVFDIISVILVNKAVGPDCISHKMLKSCKEAISKPLCLLIHLSHQITDQFHY